LIPQLARETTCPRRVRFHYLIGLLLLIVDPMFACMPYQERFTFGLEDIEPALEGTWYATWTHDGRRHTMPFRLRVEGPPRQARTDGFVRSAAACGTRTLVRSAGACPTMTFIPLEVTPLDATQGEFEALFYVGGYSFDGAILNLWLGAPDAEASASVSATGEVEHLFAGPALSTAPIESSVRLESLWHVKSL
jgi:hypothetical protein